MGNLNDFLDVQLLMTRIVEFLPRVAIAIGIFIAFILISRVARKVVRKALERAHFERVLISLLVDNVLKYVILGFGVLIALNQLGVNIAAALAGVGVVGIAVGFAAQDAFANVIAGILIFWDKPFVVGDWIRTEGEYGKVTNITLRTTRLRTPKNTYIVVPNKRIIDELMENYSKHGELRVDVPIGIAYKDDIREARKALLAAVGDASSILSEPEPDVVVDALGDSSVNLKVRVWIKSADQQKAVYYDVLERSKIALDEAGIEIPFPHMQLFVDDVDDRVWEKASGFAGVG